MGAAFSAGRQRSIGRHLARAPFRVVVESGRDRLFISDLSKRTWRHAETLFERSAVGSDAARDAERPDPAPHLFGLRMLATIALKRGHEKFGARVIS